MILEPVIGLEIHLQLKTKTKMFCGCSAHDQGAAPNSNICPVCMGHPGVLPVPNAQAVRMGIMLGLALGCKIAPVSKFDRKNYFYPDLPKAYQISQFDLPVAYDGRITIETPGGEQPSFTIGIVRAHLEEDAAKNVHDGSGKTLVDFNRGGTPLVETVTGPDFHSPQEAKAFLQEVRLIARTLGVSDADMEKGNMRCDANISLRQRDEAGHIVGLEFNPKTEIKNLNSFRHVERALEYEIQRQTKLWNGGTPPAVSTTRGWNDTKQVTEEQRVKESSQDYRYFPEPDIPALALTELADDVRRSMPELPAAKRRRLVEEYFLKPEDARQLCEDPVLAEFAERTFGELESWLNALPELDGAQQDAWDAQRKKMARLVSTWILTKLLGALSERGGDVRTMHVTPENFAELLTLIATGKLNAGAGLTVLSAMLEDGSDPSHVMEEKRLGKMDDVAALAETIDRVIAQNPAETARYRGGDKKLIAFFIGQVMKATEGTADAKETRNLLAVKLDDIHAQ